MFVPHGVDETRMLRNLGYRTPSPIWYGYNWNNTTPFKAQKATAAMLVVEPRAFVLSTMGCVDSETEYLSPDGWVRIADYNGGEVAQYHPEDETVEFVKPDEFVKLPCEQMVRIKTTRGLDQLLSPEHRVLLESRSGATKVVQAADLLENPGAFSDWGIPTTFRAPKREGLDLTNEQIRVMVAVKADGHICDDCHRVHVKLKKPRKKARLRELLDQAGIQCTEVDRDHGYAEGYTVFSFVPPELSKTYGDWWAASQRQLTVITDEVLHWGGLMNSSRPGGRWSGRNRADADFIQYAFCACGHTAPLGQVDRATGTNYTVHVRKDGRPLSFHGERRRDVWSEPSTDGFKYCFMVPSTFLVFRRNGKVFVSGNTGKTRSVLYAYDYLRKLKRVRKMLVVAPLSTLNFTWAREVLFNFPSYNVGILYGTAAKRRKILADDSFDIYVVNHDGVKMLEKELIAKNFDIVVVDEAAVFRNHKTKRHKAMARVATGRRYLWALTGTPAPKDPCDAYGLLKLIAPSHAMARSYARFRDELMHRITQFKFVPKPGATQKVYEYLQPAVRFTMDDCVDMPPVLVSDREVHISARQKKAYEELRKYCVATHEGSGITAVNAGVLLSKLVQVSSGCVYDCNKKPILLDATDRLSVTAELVTENDRKSIVFCPFVPLVKMVADHLRSNGVTVYEISGQTPKGERDKIFSTFQDNSPVPGKPEAIVAHPGTMAHGLTLTMANLILWYAPIADLEIYEQANARIARPGQISTKTQVIHLVGTPVDKQIYKRLVGKQKVQSELLQLFEE